MTSLRTRLLLAASLVLALFVALCGAALERAFRQAALESQYDKMQGLIYALLGATNADPEGNLMVLEANLPDPRLRQPQSGLDAALIDERGRIVWHSPSFPGLALPPLPEVGKFVFEYSVDPDYFFIAFGIRWIDAADKPRRYSVVVFEDSGAFLMQLNAFRGTLWLALGLSTVALLAALLALLQWGLVPVRHLAQELRRIEERGQAQLQGRYPAELLPVTEALNAMISSERSQQGRYRNALGDLAHSLKTPLAVLRAAAEDRALPAEISAQFYEQLKRMQHIVDYQLRRAAAAGSRTLSEPVTLRPLVQKILDALAKVYAAKSLQLRNELPADLRLRADQGDLYEILGNVLENAAKYGNHRVQISSQREGQKLSLIIEDDGPGFPPDPEVLLQRGVRADTHVPGQGIGLASTAEIVKAYEGRIELGSSAALGGGRVSITL